MRKHITLNELIEELETLKAKYGDCYLMGISQMSGTYKGKIAPYMFHFLPPSGYDAYRHEESYLDDVAEIPIASIINTSPSTVHGYNVKPSGKKSITQLEHSVRRMF